MIKTELKALGIEFYEEIAETELDFQNLFPLNEEGKQILSFLMHKSYDDVSASLKQDILTFLKNNSDNDVGKMYSSLIRLTAAFS